MPVGAADKTPVRITQTRAARGVKISFDVISNPEFLKEGAAVNDFLEPDRIIVGTESERAQILMSELFEPFNRNHHGRAQRRADPVATEKAEGMLGKHSGLSLYGEKYAALQGADALVICTEWQQFRVPEFAEMAARMRSKVILDGRNLYQPQKL